MQLAVQADVAIVLRVELIAAALNAPLFKTERLPWFAHVPPMAASGNRTAFVKGYFKRPLGKKKKELFPPGDR